MISKPFKRILLWGMGRGEHFDGYRQGIARFVRPHKAWDLVPVPVSLAEVSKALHRTRVDPPDGMLGVAWPGALARMAREVTFPVVSLYGGRPILGLPQVGVSDEAIGRLAAEYLAERGYRHFGFHHHPSRRSDCGQWYGFREALRARGLSAHRFAFHTYRRRPPVDPVAAASRQVVGLAINWLVELPKPVAIFCVGDGWSLLVAEACRHLQLRVPEDVAILGVDNDTTVCMEGFPPPEQYCPAGRAGGV